MSTKYKFLDPEGIYFVSFATVHWIDIFTRLEYKEIICDSIRYCQLNKGLIIHAWCLMPNHVHLIFSAKDKGTHSDILRDLKKFTTKKIVEAIKNNTSESRKEWILEKLYFAGSQNSNNKYVQLWQQDNHPIEIFSPKVISQKIEYVHNNPIVAGIVSESHHYLYSSACDYIGIKGLIDVEILDIPSSYIGYILST